MFAKRRIKLLNVGRTQIVRIPREFELAGEHAIMRKNGERLTIEPAPTRSLLKLLASLEPIGEEFDPDEEPAPAADNVNFF